MSTDNLISIGKLAAAHGTQGELLLQHVMDTQKPLKTGQALMVEVQKNSFVPYFVAKCKARNEREYLVMLEEVNTRETALRLASRVVWLPANDVKLYAAAHAPLGMVGYALYNDGQLVGPVNSVIEQPHQLLLAVAYGQDEALIPIHQETLTGIDHAQKRIDTSLPDGLLDLYR